MPRFLKTLKNKVRKYVFGNRGRWNNHGLVRNMGRTKKRTLFGRVKNRVGLAIFGSRSGSGRTIAGRAKNWIEKRLERLGLTRSRNDGRLKGLDQALIRQMNPNPGNWDDGEIDFPGLLDEIDDLLDQGADVDAEDDNGRTPLFIASSYGHVPIVKKLLKRGADFRIQTPSGDTPLSVAILNNSVCWASSAGRCTYPLIIKALRDAGATE